MNLVDITLVPVPDVEVGIGGSLTLRAYDSDWVVVVGVVLALLVFGRYWVKWRNKK